MGKNILDEMQTTDISSNTEASKPPLFNPVSIVQLQKEFTHLRDPVIDGLLRSGETMNVIAAPKTGKSWLVLSLAISIALGKKWLDTFSTVKGKVLIIDNELHPETLSDRLNTMCEAMKISIDDIGDEIEVVTLRGKITDLEKICSGLKAQKKSYQLIIIDAWYRTLPKGTDENDNGAVAQLYNIIDEAALELDSAFALIHHTSKGKQAGKGVTDVGAGAGSQSRATDCHLVLRPHNKEGVIVLDAVTRSWPPVRPICLRKDFPLWVPDNELDPTKMGGVVKGKRSPRSKTLEASRAMNMENFIESFVTDEPLSKDVILEKAKALHISEKASIHFINAGLDLDKIFLWPWGGNRKAYATKPAPEVAQDKTKKEIVIETMKAKPEKTSQEIAIESQIFCKLVGSPLIYMNTIF